MSERLGAFARRVREVQKWKVLYGEKQRLLGKSLKNSTRLMIEFIQLERRKPEDVPRAPIIAQAARLKYRRTSSASDTAIAA